MPSRKRLGISLLEAMLAAILVTTMTISVMGAWPAYHQLMDKRSKRTTANFIANRYMAIACDQGFDLVAPVSNQTVAVESVISDVLIQVDYTVNVLVGPDPTDPTNPLLKQVLVEVTYNEKGGSRKVSIATLLAG